MTAIKARELDSQARTRIRRGIGTRLPLGQKPEARSERRTLLRGELHLGERTGRSESCSARTRQEGPARGAPGERP